MVIFNAQDYCARRGRLDETCINNAGRRAASAKGGAVYIPAGTYWVSSPVYFQSNVTYAGASVASTVLEEAADANLPLPFQGLDGATGIELENFTIDGNAAGNTGGGQRTLVGFPNASYITLSQLTIRNFYGYFGNNRSGPCLSLYGNAHDNLVIGLDVSNCGAAGRASDGIYLNGSRNRVINNNISSVSDTGVVGEFVQDTIIANNVFHNTSQPIAVDGLVSQTLVEGVSVTGNVIDGTNATNGASIYITNAVASQTARITVADNIIYNTTDGHGIWVENSGNVSVTGNSLDSISSSQPVWKHGILIYDSDDVNISGNSVTRASGSGISVQGSDRVMVDSNIVSNNGLVFGDGIGIGDGGQALASSVDSASGMCDAGLATPLYLSVSDVVTVHASGTSCVGRVSVAQASDNGLQFRFGIVAAGASRGPGVVVRDSSEVTVNGNQSSGATQHNGLGIYGGSSDVMASGNQLLGNQSPILQQGSSNIALGVNQIDSGDDLSAEKLVVHNGLVLANEASVQSLTTAGKPVSLMMLTNDTPNMTRFIAGEDSAGFDWSDQEQSRAWMGLTAEGLSFGGGIMIPSSSTVVEYAATIITTADTSDAAPVKWISPGSHCVAVPEDSAAAALSGTYVIAAQGQLTLFHSPAAGAHFSIDCSAN